MGINQLPVSAPRWQEESRICFSTLIYQKSPKWQITHQPLKLDKINTDLECLEFKKFIDVCPTTFKNTQILRNKISQ